MSENEPPALSSLLESVCQQISLPPVKKLDIDGLSTLAIKVLEQTGGEIKLSHRLRSRKSGLPNPSGEMLTGELTALWLTDRNRLPFDCKLPTFVLAKILKDQGNSVWLGYYRHGKHSVHPYLLTGVEDMDVLTGFLVGQDVSSPPRAMVQPVSDQDRQSFEQEYFLFTNLSQAINFGDLRQQYNIVYCHQQMEATHQQLLLNNLSEQMELITSS